VSDGKGGTATAGFSWAVGTAANRLPVINNAGTQNATVGSTRSLQLSASDPDGDTLSYSASGLPPGLTINNSGLISGTPTAAGSFSSTVTASDGRGGNATASFGWMVQAATPGPVTGGLSGSYFNNQALSGAPLFTRKEAVDFSLSGTWPGTGLGPNGFSVRWSGKLVVPSTGSYTFQTESDDGIRLFVAGQQLINNWTEHASTLDTSGAVALTAGQQVDIVIEYFQGVGGAVAKLLWRTPGAPGFVVVPGAQLVPGSVAPINRQPSVTTPPGQNATVGTARSLQISASDPDGDVLSFSAVGLPPGLAINASSGLVSGTPSTAGSFNPSVTVIDGKGGTATTSFFWTIQGSTPGVVVGGLTGSYFSNRDLSGTPVLVRMEGVNFDWGLSSPGPGVSGNDFSVRWAGKLIVPTTGNYVFATESDDGVRLYVNGVLVINNWTLHARTLDQSAGYSLVAGQQLDIVMEFYEATNEAVARLLWKTPGANNFVVIPSAQLGTVSAPAVSTTRSWEAELGQFGGGSRVQTASNAAAGQLVGNINSVGAFTQVTVDRGTNGGMASLVVRYSNGYGQTKSLSLYVNGSRLQQIRFPSTGGWNNFADAAVVRFSLNAGINTLRLQRDAADELSADIDRFTITY